jgi:hypothetical protein
MELPKNSSAKRIYQLVTPEHLQNDEEEHQKISILNIKALRARVGKNFTRFFEKQLGKTLNAFYQEKARELEEEFKQNYIQINNLSPDDNSFEGSQQYHIGLQNYKRSKLAEIRLYDTFLTATLSCILVQQRVPRIGSLFRASQILTNYRGKKLPSTIDKEISQRYKVNQYSNDFPIIVERYLQNYFFELNEEYNVEFKGTSQSSQEEEKEQEETEKENPLSETSESGIYFRFFKSLESILIKIARGEKLEEINDITRTTVLVDDILTPTPKNATETEKQLITVQNENALADYLATIIQGLINEDFEILKIKPKVANSGYSDLTLVIKDSNAFVHEIQLQTANTENIKHGINPDGTKMESNDTELYNQRKALVMDFQRIAKENNFLEKLLSQGDEKIKEFLKFLNEECDDKAVTKLKTDGIDSDLAMKILHFLGHVDIEEEEGGLDYTFAVKDPKLLGILVSFVKFFMPSDLYVFSVISKKFKQLIDISQGLYRAGNQVISGSQSIERLKEKILSRLDPSLHNGFNEAWKPKVYTYIYQILNIS